MSSLLESPPLRQRPPPRHRRAPGHRGVETWRTRRPDVAPQRLPRPPRAVHYLPLALLTTGLVVLAPPAIVSAAMPRGGALLMVVSGLAAVALSVAIAAAGAAVWKRQPVSRDLL